eukprot:12992465-Alexandrium_andersonii.AAC.1
MALKFCLVLKFRTLRYALSELLHGAPGGLYGASLRGCSRVLKGAPACSRPLEVARGCSRLPELDEAARAGRGWSR